MRRNVMKRLAALVCICVMVFLYTMPIHAAETTDLCKLEKVLFSAPENKERVGKFSGPDVREDGTVLLEKGKKYNFCWEGMVYKGRDEEVALPYGPYMQFEVYDENGRDIFPLDGKNLYGQLSENGRHVRVEFVDVSLSQNVYKKDGVFFILDGSVKMEVQCEVQETFKAEMIRTQSGNFVSWEITNEYEHQQLSEPEEIIYYVEYEGHHSAAGLIDDEEHRVYLEFGFGRFESGSIDDIETYSCIAEFRGEKIEFAKDKASNSTEYMRPTLSFLIRVIEWETSTYKTNRTETVITTATTAGALGLGGSALANVVSGVSDSDIPPVRKKHIYGDGEEDIEQEIRMEDMPELPEEDTPNVSLSIYKPFKALVNTKGAAADLHITINGGEGLHWNYIPTAICLDGVKAVVPVVAGHGEEATLVLALTGAQLKKTHTSIFVTVVAWAYTEAGQLVKTTGSTEIALHSKGLEAEWNENGTLTVCSYLDSNLDGIGEIKQLTEDEYVVSENENGEITITAKETRFGSVKIKKRE